MKDIEKQLSKIHISECINKLNSIEDIIEKHDFKYSEAVCIEKNLKEIRQTINQIYNLIPRTSNLSTFGKKESLTKSLGTIFGDDEI